jgi:hypothetical protein
VAIDWLARTEPAIAANVTLHDQLALFYRSVSIHNTLNTVVHLFIFQLVNCAAGEEFGTSMLVLSLDDLFMHSLLK